MSDNLVEKINSIAEDRFKESDLNHCFIVDVIISNQKIEVYIDGDKGVKFQDCQRLSRAIEAYLDESQAVGEKYTLNVSSPGIGRPLKYKRQYPQNIGRKMEVQLKEDNVLITGELKVVSDNNITIHVPKTKKEDAKEHVINYENISHSKVLVSF